MTDEYKYTVKCQGFFDRKVRVEYDVIIVGARCAGATLAIYLGRAGLKVLLLDSVKMPRDMTLSTHFIQGAGMKVLDEIGVGSELRKIAPATKYLHSYLNDVHVKSEFSDDLLPYCVRRVHVDSHQSPAPRRRQSYLTAKSKQGESDRCYSGMRMAGWLTSQDVEKAKKAWSA